MAAIMPDDFVEKARRLAEAGPDGEGPYGAAPEECMTFEFPLSPAIMALMTAAGKVPGSYPQDLAGAYRRIGAWSLLKKGLNLAGRPADIPPYPEHPDADAAATFVEGLRGEEQGLVRLVSIALWLAQDEDILGNGYREIRFRLTVAPAHPVCACAAALALEAQVWGRRGARMFRIGEPMPIGRRAVPYDIGAEELLDAAAEMLGVPEYPRHLREQAGDAD
jgi:hypothetical protein